jgi:B-cell receptor-associated protein 31
MASIVWTTVFLFLVLELALTLILVMPFPRRIRNFLAKKIFKFNLGERLRKPILFVGVALSFALVESYVAHQRIIARIEQEQEMGIPAQRISHDQYFHGQDKERKYKAERNMYLAGFSLTLLFVIGRITTLMQESVELEEEAERVKTFTEEATKAEAEHTAGDKKKD